MKCSVVKSYIFFFLIVLGLASFVLAAFLTLDPFQLSHRSFFWKDKFIPSMERYQNAGLARRLWDDPACCDVLLLGSSLSQNFSPAELARTFGVEKAMSLPMSGVLPMEQKALFEYTMANHPPKDVVWEVRISYADPELTPINDAKMMRENPNKYFPEYLYDNSVLNDAYSFMSVDVVFHFLKGLTLGRPYENLHSWFDEQEEEFGRGKFLCKKHLPISKKERDKQTRSFPNIDDVLLPVLEGNQDVRFHLYFPPISMQYYASLDQEKFSEINAMRMYVHEKVKHIKNVNIYIADGLPFQEDLNQYSDAVHYHKDINSLILKLIQKKTSIKSDSSIDLLPLVNAYVDKYGQDCSRFASDRK